MTSSSDDTIPERQRRFSFWTAAAVVSHTLWTSAAPALVYRLYAEQWQLAATTTTAIFAIYPVVVVVVSTQKKSESSSRSLADNFSAIATSPTLTA